MLHAGEPLLRQLPRHARTRLGPAAARRRFHARRRRPARPRPTPYPDGRLQRAFHMPTTCQLPGQPEPGVDGQPRRITTAARNNGFVAHRSPPPPRRSRPVAMGYWTAAGPALHLRPGRAASRSATAGSARCLAQTDPNRRFLIAATSSGHDRRHRQAGNLVPDASLAAPANGTIFNRFTRHGISWTDYVRQLPDRRHARALSGHDARVRRSPSQAARPVLHRRRRRARCRASASSTPTTAPSRRRIRRTSSSARRCSPRSSTPSAPRRPGRRRC